MTPEIKLLRLLVENYREQIKTPDSAYFDPQKGGISLDDVMKMFGASVTQEITQLVKDGYVETTVRDSGKSINGVRPLQAGIDVVVAIEAQEKSDADAQAIIEGQKAFDADVTKIINRAKELGLI